MAARGSSSSPSPRRRSGRAGEVDTSQLSLFDQTDAASTASAPQPQGQVAPTPDPTQATLRREVAAVGASAVAAALPSASAAALPAIDTEAVALADAMRTCVLRWSRSLGGDAASAQAAADAAAALVTAQHEGHVCIRAEGTSARHALLASKVVAAADREGACDADLPFVLDAAGRLYLQRVFADERAIARRLATACRVEMAPPTRDVQSQLRARFEAVSAFGRPGGADGPPSSLRSLPPEGAVSAFGRPGDADEPDRQALAAALALLAPVLVVSGGPGTGKTTTLARILELVARQSPTARVALAAPTGKAAARMTQALAAARAEAFDISRDKPTQAAPRARTVHAWLGIHPRTGVPRHDAHNPLPVDLLVVDEASMLDLELARRLFDALPAPARIVLLGDKDQLAAVQAGAVFAELAGKPGASAGTVERAASLLGVEPAAAKAALQRDADADDRAEAGAGPAVVHLTRGHRFEAGSTIAHLARSVRDGDADAVIALLNESVDKSAPTAGIEWIAPGDEIAPGLVPAMHPYLEALAALDAQGDDANDDAIAACLAALDAWRPLCAVHDGPSGTRAWNARASALVRRAGTMSADPWFTGRAVMVTRNDTTLGLVNGDVGIVLPSLRLRPLERLRRGPTLMPSRRDGGGLTLRQAAFLRPDGGIVRWPVARLPAVETAFATSVHKAQGSEFDRVTLVLPTPWQRPCTRELVYTAITRARRHVTVIADEASLRTSIAARTERLGGLGDRLREAFESHRQGRA